MTVTSPVLRRVLRHLLVSSGDAVLNAALIPSILQISDRQPLEETMCPAGAIKRPTAFFI